MLRRIWSHIDAAVVWTAVVGFCLGAWALLLICIWWRL